MSRLGMAGQARLNLSQARVLLVSSSAAEAELLMQVLVGFGTGTIRRAEGVADAQGAVQSEPIDLVLIDHVLDETTGFDFMKWLRLQPGQNRFAPAILTTAHAHLGVVRQARDAGANFVIVKPIVPGTLFERLMWIVRDRRMFVESPAYVGPDRRFAALGPPGGGRGRRSTDLSAELGEAKDPNMSQADIDAMLSPKRMAPA